MDIFAYLKERLPFVDCERNFSFAKHTTIGCGGTAAAALSPGSCEDVAQVLSLLERERIPYCLLGSGANVLPAEGYFEGAVVRFVRLKTLFLDNEIFAGAGVTGGELLAFAHANCVGGFEPFTGIPTSVGGGVAMNAGVRERHFGDLVSRVLAVERGKIYTIPAKSCLFSEKNSLFLQKIAVTGVYFKATTSSAEKIETETQRYRLRRAHLPKGRSMGCTFVNPDGISAGKLVEECGLKGRTKGKVRVSDVHANFIINEGGSADDVSALISEVKSEVARQTGISLREEIKRIP